MRQFGWPPDARGSGDLSFLDALVVVAAAKRGASVLYPEDWNDGQEILGLHITNPFPVGRYISVPHSKF